MSKAELLAKEVAKVVNAGQVMRLPSVDFNDPNRPKTCLEVDFPIVPINQVADIEGNAGKPIYQMSKWWARRRSSVFRGMLLAAATRAPADPDQASELIWNAYYGNHGGNDEFRKLKVADIFMGGGTTLVEGARLGMQMWGNDLNPVAWFVVKSELADVSRAEIEQLLATIEAGVKPQIMPFYAIDCPRGHKGKWVRVADDKEMDSSFNPLTVPPEERALYRYTGPNTIHTFWAKHGPCQAQNCGHRTPIMTSPLIAEKELSVAAWLDFECPACQEHFDIEREEFRMAPAASPVVSPDEPPFALMDAEGHYACPHCGKCFQDKAAAMKGESSRLGKCKSKKVAATLLVHPAWLKGAPSHDESGQPYGGSVTDLPDATARWNDARARTLRHVEVRGPLPVEVTCPQTQVTFSTSKGTVPKQAKFACQSETCGRQAAIVDSVGATGKTAPMAVYAIQGYCPECDKEGRVYSGRFFAAPSESAPLNAAIAEWHTRMDKDLRSWWPRSAIPFGHMTHQRQPLPQHGYLRWSDMFNPRQLLALSQLFRTIVETEGFSWSAREYVLGAFQNYLRNQNMFCFWHRTHDHFVPHLSNNNFHPKSTVIEMGGTIPLGYGAWKTTAASLIDAIVWRNNPWEGLPVVALQAKAPALAKQIKSKAVKLFPQDSFASQPEVACGSSSELGLHADGIFDLVITDPPFGGLLHYSELSDFFYVWLRLALKDHYPDLFSGEYTPKTMEAVTNVARNPDDADEFYQRILTACWREAHRILKPGGMLAFTFHHSEDEPWVGVLESLFDAGFYLEATYPIRSDETKGEGEFGAKTIEYDIVHVCRKRVEDPAPISWAKLRRQIVADVRELATLLDAHQKRGLQPGDLKVIRRGKALEYFSRHYGHVYVEQGREFSVREALAGINNLLDDEEPGRPIPPVLAEPFTRQFLRIFDRTATVPRDQIQKIMRGTGASPTLFTDRDWCREERKVFTLVTPLDFAITWKGKPRKGMSRDFDQALFLIGAAAPDSGIRVDDTLNSSGFDPHPALGDILEWMVEHGPATDIRQAAATARTLYVAWAARNKSKVDAQLKLFDLEPA